jgi:ABC-2 type transport system ATP-binding protein
MRQRVKLAQAIVHDPPLCLLDEPTSGLDPTGREEMLGLLRSLSRLGGHSFVLSTHLLPDADGLCDQVLLLDGGRLLASGSVQQLLSSHAGEMVARVKGDWDGFVAALARKGLSARVAGDSIQLNLLGGETRSVFEAAVETGVQVRYLGPSVSTIEGLFLERVQSAAKGDAQ